MVFITEESGHWRNLISAICVSNPIVASSRGPLNTAEEQREFVRILAALLDTSVINNYQSQFDRVISRSSFEELVRALRENNRSLAKNCCDQREKLAFDHKVVDFPLPIHAMEFVVGGIIYTRMIKQNAGRRAA